MEIKYKINIAKDFSPFPAGRYRSEGKFSGEVFLTDLLLPNIIVAIFENSILEIDLNGMNGYPSSFISGSFGKLTFALGKVMGKKEATKLIQDHIIFVCDDSSAKIKAFENEIKNPITK